MPITSASNGVKPQYRALAVIKVGVPVTPTEINDYVGTGDYAGKYIGFLRRDGFVFEINKDGRAVTSYTLISEPSNAEALRNLKPKAGKTNVAKIKSTPVRQAAKPVKNIDVVAKKYLREVGLDLNYGARENGELGTYAIDNDFDSYAGDIKDLILDY